ASKPITNALAAIWKSIIFLCIALIFTAHRSSYYGKRHFWTLFKYFIDAYPGFNVGLFEAKNYIVEHQYIFYGANLSDFGVVKHDSCTPATAVWTNLRFVGTLPSPKLTPLAVGFVHVFSTYLCYAASTFACQICIQPFSMALPLTLGVPFTVAVLGYFCSLQSDDLCFTMGLPGPYFYNCPGQGSDDNLEKFLFHEFSWVWLLCLFSQTQITSHIWKSPRNRMSKVSKYV
ncbi:hypothetical protein BIW11_08111, partial [Tropilaelaps mercedesae]